MTAEEAQRQLAAIGRAGIPAHEAMRRMAASAQAMGRSMVEFQVTVVDRVTPAMRRLGAQLERLDRELNPHRWELVVEDPAERWARSPREFLRQLRDMLVHDFWMAQGRPERSPGASWRRLPD